VSECTDRIADDLATKIKRARLRRGETQAEFAARFPVDRRTVQKWEAGTIPQAKHRAMLDDLL